MERARVERRANDASFESLPVEVVREILVRRARDDARGAASTACALTRVSKTFRAAVESARAGTARRGAWSSGRTAAQRARRVATSALIVQLRREMRAALLWIL